MTTLKIRPMLLAAATIMTLAGGAAMAAPTHDDMSSTTMSNLTFTQPAQASTAKQALPWYESGYTSKAQLQRQIQSEQFDFGDAG